MQTFVGIDRSNGFNELWRWNMENYRKLFHFIQATSKKSVDVSEMNREVDSLSIQNQQWHLVSCADYFQAQFDCSLASAPPAAISGNVQWPATIEPLTEAEIPRAIQAPERHKASGSNGLSSAPFKDERMELARELQLLFSNVWYSEEILFSFSFFWGGEGLIVVPTCKNYSHNESDDHKSISFSSVILRRLCNTCKGQTREEHFGFSAVCGRVDHVFVLRQLSEHGFTSQR